jgi:hypothetical protein
MIRSNKNAEGVFIILSDHMLPVASETRLLAKNSQLLIGHWILDVKQMYRRTPRYENKDTSSITSLQTLRFSQPTDYKGIKALLGCFLFSALKKIALNRRKFSAHVFSALFQRDCARLISKLNALKTVAPLNVNYSYDIFHNEARFFTFDC